MDFIEKILVISIILGSCLIVYSVGSIRMIKHEEKYHKIENEDVKVKVNDIERLPVVKREGCEYIVNNPQGSYAGKTYTHKGNCNNTIHVYKPKYSFDTMDHAMCNLCH